PPLSAAFAALPARNRPADDSPHTAPSSLPFLPPSLPHSDHPSLGPLPWRSLSPFPSRLSMPSGHPPAAVLRPKASPSACHSTDRWFHPPTPPSPVASASHRSRA